MLTLEELSTDKDSETSSKANCFLKSVLSSDFLMSLCCLSILFSYTLPLCKILQSPSCDLVSALDHVQLVTNTFRKIRENVITEFKDIFETAQGLLNIVDENETLKTPRTVLRQQHRANVNTSDSENYFRIVVMIPLLDDFITQLEMRFENHKSVLSSLYILIPSVLGKSEEKFNEENFKFYRRFLDWDTIKTEFVLWKTKCHEQQERPQ